MVNLDKAITNSILAVVNARLYGFVFYLAQIQYKGHLPERDKSNMTLSTP